MSRARSLLIIGDAFLMGMDATLLFVAAEEAAKAAAIVALFVQTVAMWLLWEEVERWTTIGASRSWSAGCRS